jgi:hypothetical protein
MTDLLPHPELELPCMVRSGLGRRGIDGRGREMVAEANVNPSTWGICGKYCRAFVSVFEDGGFVLCRLNTAGGEVEGEAGVSLMNLVDSRRLAALRSEGGGGR